jgi:hypothetical protein
MVSRKSRTSDARAAVLIPLSSIDRDRIRASQKENAFPAYPGLLTLSGANLQRAYVPLPGNATVVY